MQREQGCRLPGPQPPHQQQLVALTEASLLGQGARLDEVDEAPAGVAPEQAELGDEAVAAERGVLHQEPGTPHVPHGRDRRPEGSGAGEKGVRQLWSGPPVGAQVIGADTLGESGVRLPPRPHRPEAGAPGTLPP